MIRALIGAVAVAVLAWWVCAPILEYPQLEPDDFRYVEHVEQLQRGEAGVEAGVVENRWDHLWFTKTDGVVRFFRPTVVGSFWFDAARSGDFDKARGAPKDLNRSQHTPYTSLLATNLWIYVLCALLALAVLWPGCRRWWLAVLGAALWTSFAAHAETIWYVSGRTDSIAGLAFLAALAAHIWGDRIAWLRWLAVAFFAVGFVTKELTIALPLVAFVHDRYVARRATTLLGTLRASWRLWLAYASCALAFWIWRSVMLGGASGSQLVWPYFVSPTDGRFPGHLYVQFRSYLGNLFAGEVTAPFMKVEQLAEYASWLSTGLALAAIAAIAFLCRRNSRALVALAIALGTWLPTCFVYVSERYLYLPSLGLALAVVIALDELMDPRPSETPANTRATAGAGSGSWAAYFACALMLLWTGLQAARLQEKNYLMSDRPRMAEVVSKHVASLGSDLPKGARILFVDFPSDVVHAQFLEAQLRADRRDPSLSCRVLNLLPSARKEAERVALKKTGDRSLELRAAPLLEGSDIFPMLDFSQRERVEKARTGMSVQVLEGDARRCRAVRIELPRPLRDYVILRFVPGPQHPHPPLRALQSRLERWMP